MKATHYIYKYLIPKSLVSRFLLIITLPVIIAQLFAVYIFYQRHWSNILNTNSSTIAREVKLVTYIYIKHGIENATHKAKILHMNLVLQEQNQEEKSKLKGNFNSLSSLENALSTEVKYPTYISLINNKTDIQILCRVGNNYLVFTRSAKHLLHPTTWIFVIWMISLTTLLLLVSLIFSRNQIKSILSLAEAADSFVCGESKDITYKPSGASEIRKAGYAFLKMKKRIESYIVKRTQTLAMISHDLKTPLTRINLRLEMMEGEEEEINEMKQDVDNMKQMIATYLDFARGEGGEEFVKIKLKNWIEENINFSSYTNLKILIEQNAQNPLVAIKPLSFKRAIENILGNANKYAQKAIITIRKSNNLVILDVEDNGEGIPDSMKKQVFTPFYRIDNSRNLGTDGSVGLGLSITNEIIIGHNGTIELHDSLNLKGLSVRIILPLARS